jgi:hypothetical protein
MQTKSLDGYVYFATFIDAYFLIHCNLFPQEKIWCVFNVSILQSLGKNSNRK